MNQLFSRLQAESAHADTLLNGRCVVASSPAPYRRESNDAAAAENEDSLLAVQLNEKTAVLAVADGAGGYAKGAHASQLMLAKLQEKLAAAADSTDLRLPILEAIETCNRELIDTPNGGATTLIAVELQGSVARYYQAGDSSALIVGQRGAIAMQSIPQSLVGYGVESGLLPEDAALTHDDRHIVLNLVGSEEMRVVIGPPVKMKPRDTLLLCSDGLTDNVGVEAIVNTIRTGRLDKKSTELLTLASNHMDSADGHPDDCSLILFRQHGRTRKL